MSPNVPDSELVVRAKAGDEAAFTQIYERYAMAIYRYVYFRLGEPELAEDIQAEVFLRMLEGIHRYEDRGWPISAWLYRIARDRTIDMMRRRRKRPQMPLESWGGLCDGPEYSVGEQLEYEELTRTLQDLTEDQRRVIQIGNACFDSVIEPLEAQFRFGGTLVQFGDMLAAALGMFFPAVECSGKHGFQPLGLK